MAASSELSTLHAWRMQLWIVTVLMGVLIAKQVRCRLSLLELVVKMGVKWDGLGAQWYFWNRADELKKVWNFWSVTFRATRPLRSCWPLPGRGVAPDGISGQVSAREIEARPALAVILMNIERCCCFFKVRKSELSASPPTICVGKRGARPITLTDVP